MGKLVSSSITNLISGVSQQPWSVRLPTQAEEQINCSSTVTDFLKRRPATKHITKLRDNPLTSLAIHTINRDVNEKYIVAMDNSTVTVSDIYGNKKTVNVSASAYNYIHATGDPKSDLRFLTINDYTFVVNKAVTVGKLGDVIPVHGKRALLFVKLATYNTTYRVFLDGKGFEYTTLDGMSVAGEAADALSSTDIASQLASAISKEFSTTFTVTNLNSVILLQRIDGGNFTVRVEDTRSNSNFVCHIDTAQKFSDLPTIAPRGYVIQILGDASSSFDNYYCKFEPEDSGTDFGYGNWVETVAPGVEYKLNPATMPHALVRQADGSFTFDALSWDNRDCGDDKSAPFPSFVGRTINNIFFYRNRLSFLSGDNVIMSEVGSYYNFFATTVTTLVDSDPIDVAASSTKSSVLKYVVSFSGGLILFSEQAQFSLEHDTVLSNSTVSVKPVTEFESDMRAAPVSSGKTIFFATNKGEYGGVREYITLPDNTDQNDATDVTAHVPRYLGGNIYGLVCSTGEDTLFTLSENGKNFIGVYKYFWNGNEKIQSAWSKWKLCGNVVNLSIINTDVFVIMQYADGIYLEKMSIASGKKDDNETFEYCMDRKITEGNVTFGAYDSVNKKITITLPYPVYGDACNLIIVSRNGNSSFPAGRVFFNSRVNEGTTSFDIPCNSNIAGLKLYIGVQYTSQYIFSPFAIREGDSGKGNALMTGRLQLRTVTLNCANTGFLNIRVSPKFRNTSTYVFTGREVGHGTNILGEVPLYTGPLSYPLLSVNTNVQLSVDSNSYLPFALVNATWEGFYNSRNQRV